MDKLKEKSIIIVGVIRNGENYLTKVFENIHKIGKLFNKYKIILYENDSNDNTKNIITKEILEHPNKIDYICGDNEKLDEKFPYRTLRLAYIRNIILNKVIMDNVYNKYDYMLNMDMDDVNIKPYIYETFDKIFQYDESIWDVQSVHQKEIYYDVWAFRKKGYIEFDCWEKVYEMLSQNNNLKKEELVEKYVRKYQKPYSITRGLIPVISAFGGATIYKIDFLKKAVNARYIGIKRMNKRSEVIGYRETCEHVSFHQGLTNIYKGKMFINPEWINM